MRGAFLERMAATFKPEAVERKAKAWDWLFGRRVGPEGAQPVVLAAMSGDAFVGGAIFFPSLYQLDGEEKVFYSPYATNIDPSARGLGINLIKRLYSIKPTVAPIMRVGVPGNEQLAKVNERFGAFNATRLNIFKVLRGGRALARRKPWAAPLAAPGDLAWRLWDGMQRLGRPRLAAGETITRETVFGPDYADFWERARRRHRFLQVRDADYMTWRFVDMPVQAYEILFLRRQGRVAGVAIVGTAIDPERNTGQVTDILSEDGDPRSLALLLTAACDRLTALGAEVAALGCCENAALQEAARLAGFTRTKVSRPAQFYDELEANRDRIRAAFPELHMTRADQDEDY